MSPLQLGLDAAKKDLKRGAWTREEDERLAECIKVHGETKWRLVPAKAGLNRCARSCRMRWLNYLRPSIKRGNITEQEEDLIIRLHKLLGNRWSLIAGRLPGRTDNEIKNYWKTHLSKKVKQQQQQNQQKEKLPTLHEPEKSKIKPAEESATDSTGKMDQPSCDETGFSTSALGVAQFLGVDDSETKMDYFWNSSKSGNLPQGTPSQEDQYNLDLSTLDGYVSSIECDTDFQWFIHSLCDGEAH